MPKQNLYLENKKPIELVQELKDEYKVPSFEEFNRTYENIGDLNYDDLSGGSIGEVGGYGPCTSSYCSCSNYELRQQLRQKQEDLDSLWEKFKEYDSKWEDYKKVVDTYLSTIDFIRHNPISEIRNNPLVKVATEFIPGAGLFTFRHDVSVEEGEEAAEEGIKNGCRSCYSKIVEKYNQVKDWYCRTR